MKSLVAVVAKVPLDRTRVDSIRCPEFSRAWTIVLACVGIALTGCGVMLPLGSGGSGERDGPGDSRIAAFGVSEAVRNLPKSRRGNMREYTVRGQTYRTLASAEGYRESGVASWYGRKFHGRETSSGEPFDMHAMTAAHKTLPLPTFVRVTHQGTGDSIIVKVNDRGPFVHDRLIDLSYGAALHLGVLENGTAEVLVEALSTHIEADGRAVEPGKEAPIVGTASTDGPGILQLGAFREADNAEALLQRAAPHLATTPQVIHDSERDLYRVRVGPLADAAAMDAALAGLEMAGIDSYTLLAVSP